MVGAQVNTTWDISRHHGNHWRCWRHSPACDAVEWVIHWSEILPPEIRSGRHSCAETIFLLLHCGTDECRGGLGAHYAGGEVAPVRPVHGCVVVERVKCTGAHGLVRTVVELHLLSHSKLLLGADNLVNARPRFRSVYVKKTGRPSSHDGAWRLSHKHLAERHRLPRFNCFEWGGGGGVWRFAAQEYICVG